MDPIITADLSLCSTNMVANLDLSSIWEPEDSGLQLKPHQNSPEDLWKQMARPHPRGLLVISVLVVSFSSEARADAAGLKAAL